MDKEKLLQYFDTHYLSRREVLFKLPLSAPIDTFWPELLNRRKTGAVVLPLLNASGMPYWYVLTQKMVAASERLCEEAMSQEDQLDPYRAQMTSAMTEEMFFTSFVEGAQIPLEEAMGFLERGTEPENVQEQMIWNNRQAWSTLVKGLYKPLDEQYLKSMAFLLTEEMDGCAEDYRQIDTHTIAAMNDETYTVPSAWCIPDRVRSLCAYLAAPDTHPLIKAAVGQAYILVTRPFPEGNERLSRMISSAILLRSGYGFFRDISISGMIARENYNYYKAMCDILRAENGSDMTYFMEYYLDLLARAVADKKDRGKRRDDEQIKEALERERRLALQPIKNDAPVDSLCEANALGTVTPSLPDADLKVTFTQEQDTEVTESTPEEPSPVTEITNNLHTIIASMTGRPTDRKARVLEHLSDYINSGVRTFTREQWQEKSHITKTCAADDCSFMLNFGLITSRKVGAHALYTITCTTERKVEKVENSENIENSILSGDIFTSVRQSLRKLTASGSDAEKRIAAILESFLSDGKTFFMCAEWVERAHMSETRVRNDMRIAQQMKLIEMSKHGYKISLCPSTKLECELMSPLLSETLAKLVMTFHDSMFTKDDVIEKYNVSGGSLKYCLNQLYIRNIIVRHRMGNKPNQYSISPEYLRTLKPGKTAYSTEGTHVNSYGTGMVASGIPAPAMRV